MNNPWAGTWVVFQVTFTEFFIASTLFVSIAYKSGWRSVAAGSLLGAAGIAVVAAVLGTSLKRIPIHVLDWISGALLLAFGAYLAYEFCVGLRKKAENVVRPESSKRFPHDRLHWPGVSLAAWAVITEGLEVLVVWLAIALKQGFLGPTTGVGLGVIAVLLVALFLSWIGIFERLAAVVLDGLAALIVTGYGVYFLLGAAKVF